MRSFPFSSPFTVLGSAGPTDPLASLVQGPGLYLAMAGLPATFTVQTRYSNRTLSSNASPH
jgi:hypothetical protein